MTAPRRRVPFPFSPGPLLALLGLVLMSRVPVPRPAAEVAAGAVTAADTPSPALDSIRVCDARQEYRFLRRMEARLSAARSLAAYRHGQFWADAARVDYRWDYQIVTVAARRRAHLVPPW